MKPADWAEFERFKAQTQCAKKFQCVYSQVTELCKAGYDPRTAEFECLEADPAACQFADSVPDRYRCTCQVRKFIADHFDQWAESSLRVLKP